MTHRALEDGDVGLDTHLLLVLRQVRYVLESKVAQSARDGKVAAHTPSLNEASSKLCAR